MVKKIGQNQTNNLSVKYLKQKCV